MSELLFQSEIVNLQSPWAAGIVWPICDDSHTIELSRLPMIESRQLRSYLCPACTYRFTPFAFVITPKRMWLGISSSMVSQETWMETALISFLCWLTFFLSTLQPEHTSTLVLKNQKVPQGPFSTYRTVESWPYSIFRWSGPCLICLITADAVFKCMKSWWD